MVIPPTASEHQRFLLNQYRHKMILILVEQERDFTRHEELFRQLKWDSSWLGEAVKQIQKTRNEY